MPKREDSSMDAAAPSGARMGLVDRGIDLWALSLSCAVGWGVFVMPASTMLPLAGPLGAIAGMVLGAVAMVVFAHNLFTLGHCHRGLGGAYAYVRETLGFDHAFLVVWSLGLAYVAIIWANATAVALIVRQLAGPVFQAGYLYSVGSYDIYIGEIALTTLVLLGGALLATRGRRFASMLLRVASIGLVLCLGFCGLSVLTHAPLTEAFVSSELAHDVGVASGVLAVFVLAPWAYVGFETTSQQARGNDDTHRTALLATIVAVATAALLYCLSTAMAVMGTPEGFPSWVSYIDRLGELQGVESLPTFNAVAFALGQPGIVLMCIAVVCAVGSSLVGLYWQVGILLSDLAVDGIIDQRFSERDGDGTPRRAIRLVAILSLVVPFLGRSAIGWIVDVTSISASIAYFYLSLCALIEARRSARRSDELVGALGCIASVAFFIVPLVPHLWSSSSLAAESYFIIAAWGALGLLFFFIIFREDTRNRFGKSSVVWIAMLALVLASSALWVRQSAQRAAQAMVEGLVDELNSYDEQQREQLGIRLLRNEVEKRTANVTQAASEATEQMRKVVVRTSTEQIIIITFGMVVMFGIFRLMTQRHTELEAHRLAAEQTSKAKSAFFNNVSHDIRTPMNAIVGYTKLAKRPDITHEELRDYLGKIDDASGYLLGLVNDILDMSRIESGRMELNPEHVDLRRAISGVHDLFATQMAEKGLHFVVTASDIQNNDLWCDGVRLDSVLLNLVSNAYKFTPEGGEVRLEASQRGYDERGRGIYRFVVSDTGIGMSEEFVGKIFEPFEREHSTAVAHTQGTGLGTAITKSFVDMMGGTIEVRSKLGEGSVFEVTLPLELMDEELLAREGAQASLAKSEADAIEGVRVLLVDDNEINLELTTLLFEEQGVQVSCASNGQEALDVLWAGGPGAFDVVLMDVRMPVMNGLEAARAIRALADPALAALPLVAASASTDEQDVQQALNAGFDDYVTKPIDIDRVSQAILRLLR